MRTLLRVSVCAALGFMGAAVAHAQPAPAGGDWTAPPVIAPPTVTTPITPAAPTGPASNDRAPRLEPTTPPEGFAPPTTSGGRADPRALPDAKGPLSPVQGNQTYTLETLLGYVNGQPIMASDVFRPINDKLVRLATSSRTLADFRSDGQTIIRNQLSSLVSDILVVTAAEGKLTEDDQRKVEFVLDQQRKRLLSEHGGSEAALAKYLQSQGSTLSRELGSLRRTLVKELYFQKYLAPKIVITRDMALDAYNKDPKKWQEQAQVELYTITLPVTRWLREPGANGTPGPIKAAPSAAEIQNAEAQATAAARDIITKIRAGQDFARLVEDNQSADSQVNKGGRWGTISRGSLVNKKMEDFVFSLKAGTVGEPLLLHESDFHNSTVVIAKVGEKHDARTVPFSEAQPTIVRNMQQAQLRELESQEMERLSRNSAIEAVDRMINVAVEAAVMRYATK